MSDFFRYAVNNRLIDDYAELLDWFFDDNKFSEERGWIKKQEGGKRNTIKFSKRVGKLLKENNIEYKHDSIKNLKFPETTEKKAYIIIGKKEGLCKDIVRHIRNGIAHGKTKFKKVKKQLYIEISDYNKQEKNRTAYMFIPMEIIIKIQKIYKEILNSER